MSRTVFCQKYQKEMEGLPTPPYPGPKGQYLFENLSRQAWMEWLKHQTRLINEKRLNLMEPATQTYLQGELDKFINNQEHDQADGYVPPNT